MLCEEEGLDFVINLTHEFLLSDERLTLLGVIYLFLNNEWVVMTFQVCQWRDDLILLLFSAVLIEGINWLKDRDTDGLSFEFTVLSVLEADLAHGLVLGTHAHVNLTCLTELLGPKHDTSRQVNNISKH